MISLPDSVCGLERTNLLLFVVKFCPNFNIKYYVKFYIYMSMCFKMFLRAFKVITINVLRLTYSNLKIIVDNVRMHNYKDINLF